MLWENTMNEITIKEFIELIDFQIHGSDEHMWQCFGENAWYLDHNDPNTDDVSKKRYSLHIIYDINTQFVYTMEVWDYQRNTILKWIHPDYINDYDQECCSRGVSNKDRFDPHEVFHFIPSSRKIMKIADFVINNIDYTVGYPELANPNHKLEKDNSTVEVEVELEEPLWLELSMMAHERDITLNSLVNELLTNYIKEISDE
jgi:hypothetical protein